MKSHKKLLRWTKSDLLLDELKHKLALAKEHYDETSEKHMNHHPDVGWGEISEASNEVNKWQEAVDAVESMQSNQLLLSKLLS